MRAPAGSLVDAHDQQPDLLSPDIVPTPEPRNVDRRNPEYTAAGFFAQRPAEYRLAVSLLFSDGLPHAAVARMLGVSRNTVAAVYQREAQSANVEQLRSAALAAWRTVGKLARERLMDILLHLPDARDLTPEQLAGLAHKLSVAAGVAADKEAELSGLVVPRVHLHIDATDEYRALVDRARKMGLGEDARGQREPAGTDGQDPEGRVREADFREVQAAGAASPGADAECYRPASATSREGGKSNAVSNVLGDNQAGLRASDGTDDGTQAGAAGDPAVGGGRDDGEVTA